MKRTVKAARLFGSDAIAAGRAVGRALRRPATYPGAVKEAFWAGFQVAMYPVGLMSEATDSQPPTSLGGRFSPELPLRYLDPQASSTPIVLLHGFFHNRSAFLVMRRSLRRYGFVHVDTLNSNVIGHDVRQLAEAVGRHVDIVRERTGSDRVHIVGHSLGGLVARYYVQQLGGDQTVHTCVTLGSPHNGSHAAYIGRGRAARQLRPGSPLFDELEASAHEMPVRFVCYYSNLDALVIPASSAKLTNPALRATNVLVKDHGHMSLLISRPLIRSIAEALASSEGPPASVVSMHAKPGAAPSAGAQDAG